MKIFNIRVERIKRKWTLEYVGKLIGITKSAVHDIETGRRDPSFKVLLKLLELYEKPYYKDIAQLFSTVEDDQSSK